MVSPSLATSLVLCPAAPELVKQARPFDAHSLLTLRKLLRLSQPELAIRLDVDQVSVSRWETGDRRIPPHMRDKLIALIPEAERQVQKDAAAMEGLKELYGYPAAYPTDQ